MVRAAVLSAPGESLRLAELSCPSPAPARSACGSPRPASATATCRWPAARCASPCRRSSATRAPAPSSPSARASRASRAGDRVVLCWAPPCGTCWFCRQGEPWLCERSSDAAAGAAYAHRRRPGRLPGPVHRRLRRGDRRVRARPCSPVPDGVPLEHAALVGCAVMTGVGAVLNTAQVRAGQSVLVVGLGGVGLSVVQGARLAGAGAGRRRRPGDREAGAGLHHGRHRGAGGRRRAGQAGARR